MSVPMIFLYRRLIYVYSALLLSKYLIAQIAIQILIIQFYLAILHLLRPIESKADLWKQTLDECTYLLLIYILLCFTCFIDDFETKNKLGYVYTSIMFTNIGIHLILMIKSFISTLILRVKRCFARRHLYKFFCFMKKTTTIDGFY